MKEDDAHHFTLLENGGFCGGLSAEIVDVTTDGPAVTMTKIIFYIFKLKTC